MPSIEIGTLDVKAFFIFRYFYTFSLSIIFFKGLNIQSLCGHTVVFIVAEHKHKNFIVEILKCLNRIGLHLEI